MTAAVIKLDPLANAVWPAAQDHHFLALAWARLAFHIAHGRGLVGGIHIGRLGLEFGGTCVDAFEYGRDAQVLARAAHIALGAAGQLGQARIGKAHHFQFAQPVFCDWQAVFAHLVFGGNDFADAGQEPGVKHGDGLNFIIA